MTDKVKEGVSFVGEEVKKGANYAYDKSKFIIENEKV